MPAMPRIPGKGKKIAYKLLGVPANIAEKKDPGTKKLDARLAFENTSRSKGSV